MPSDGRCPNCHPVTGSPPPHAQPDEGSNGADSQETRVTSGPGEHRPGEHPLAQGGECSLPSVLGRYRAERVLGKGGFGKVILAEDLVLKRHVAIKILSHTASDPAAAASFLNEARLLARMDHPGIMPVFDALEIDDGRFCIVSRFVDGPSLAQLIREKTLPPHEVASIMAAIGEALDHAHRQGVVHLDVKPANIVIAGGRRPVLLDFGIARLWQNFSGSSRVAGTPAYMSPEQARGEDHLVDGRSDIFSAGTVLYELLTGQRAWDAATAADLAMCVSAGDLVPPRRVDPSIPQELDRICLKAMQPRPRERYATAADFALELREWLATESETLVIPATSPASGPLPLGSGTADAGALVRGLRGYDESDADFFLNLVPGPRDRSGLPDSVRTWKQRLESTTEHAPRVCVLYGPSGSGKSSFLRAAVIPRLARHAHVVRTDASDPKFTERLVHAVSSRFSGARAAQDAPALLQSLRQGTMIPVGQKLVLVIDQTEQWLQSTDDRRIDLPGMLRQCDGARVQILLVVRDDFWRGLTLLLDDAETAINPDNSEMIDLFDLRHAAHVLELSGRAMATLPSDPGIPLSASATEFIRNAVAGLADHGLVSPARLALFTQMFRSRPWSLEALQELGGIHRLGAAFLEDAFAGSHAPAPRRLHERAARNVLSLMLPETGEVRGPPVAESLLSERSGYQNSPRLFADLLKMLDKDLRLLMPVETDEGSSGGRAWQLTHDQLISALRDWLRTRESATPRGRAGIRLHERAAEYRLHANPRTAPRLSEWLQLRFLTTPDRWTRDEAAFMQRGRRSTFLSLGAMTLLIASGWVALAWIRNADRAQAAAAQILSAPAGEAVRIALKSLPLKDRLVPILRESSRPEGSASASAAVALLALGNGDAPRAGKWMLEAGPAEFVAARDAFLLSGSPPPVALWSEALDDQKKSPAFRIRAMAALAALAPEKLPATFDSDPASWLMLTGSEAPAWASIMGEAAARSSIMGEAALSLDLGLRSLIGGTSRVGGISRVREACAALAALHAGDADTLASLVRVFPVEHLGMLREAIAATDLAGVASLRQQLEATPPVPPRTDRATEKDRVIYKSRAHAATLLAALGAPFELNGFTLERSTDRTERTLFTLAAVHAGVPAIALADRLRHEPSAGARFALLIALASYRQGDLPGHDLTRFLDWLRDAWLTDPDGGCHSAMIWIARQWLLHDLVGSLEESAPRLESPQNGFTWWVTPSGVDMRIVTLAPGIRTALAAKEFTDPNSEFETSGGQNYAWYSAAALCSKISRQEGMPESELIYTSRGEETAVSPEALSLRAYRLPTEVEWQAARGDTVATLLTAGAFPEFLRLDSWLYLNSAGRPRPPAELRPNDGGFFDIVGNAAEWMHEIGDNNRGRLAGGDYTEQWDEVLRQPFWDYDVTGHPTLIPGLMGFRLARTVNPR